MQAITELLTELEITPEQYELVRKLVYDRAGINLGENREQLVQARLAKRIRRGKLSGFDEYFQKLRDDRTGEEISELIDAISTNTTHFFRESDHFEFLASSLRQRIEDEQWARRHQTLRIWCAASSSGEEPYSIAMTVRTVLAAYPAVDAKILATDISQTVLARAQAGRYAVSKLNSVPVEYRQKYFAPAREPGEEQVEVVPALKNMISFRQFNLIRPEYPFTYGFHYIFCRNVMIYFDRSTQESVVLKMSRHLQPGGYLIVGHSETLNRISHGLEYIRPTTYRKAGGNGGR